MQIRRPSMQDKILNDLRQHERTLGEGLKSTSLIIKTMRSASEFDEAMRRLSITSDTIIEPNISTLPANGYYEKPIINMAHIKTSSISTNFMRKYSSDSSENFTNSPKLKLGNPSLPISQQLAQLRLMYEMNASQDTEDSADEEVKSYFFENSDESDSEAQVSNTRENDHGIVISGSWSRIKAKRTLQKLYEIENDTCLLHKEIPKSNVMSIELHSPQGTLKKPESIKYISSAPIAKPRRFFLHQRQVVPTHDHMSQAKNENSLETKEALRIVKEARGARKLREHELSYFGIQLNNNSEPTNATKTTKISSNLSDRHKRHSIDNDSNVTKTNLTMKDEPVKNWPDLLNHNPIPVDPYSNKSFTAIRPAERKSLKSSKPIESDQDHLYENITKELTPVFKITEPNSDSKLKYDRKTDTKRDAQILKEMSYNADHTLRTVTNESALKDQRRHSIRRQSTPLETINEKSIARRVNNTCVAVKVVRNRSPNNNNNSNRSRSSSISSDNSLTRMRTRSLSSERESTTGKNKNHDQTDNINRKQRSTRSFHESRNLNSLESHRRPSTSGDESHTALRVKAKRVCSTCNHGLPAIDIHKTSKISNDKEKDNTSKEKSAISTTHFSSRERAKCSKDIAQKPSSHRQSEREHKHRTSSKDRRDISTVSTHHKRREEAPVQNSFRKFTSVLGLGKSSVEKKVPISSQSLESRSVARDKSHESNSRGQSKQISATQNHERRKTASTRNSSRDKKKVSEHTPSDSMTYVYETNFKSNYLENYIDETYKENERCIEKTESVDLSVKKTVEEPQQNLHVSTNLIPPQKPPRKKHKQLIENQLTEIEKTANALPRFSLSDPLPPLPLERIIIPMQTYSQKSTLRKSSLPRKNKTFDNKSPSIIKRRPSLKYTQSTSSSFAFIPTAYYPAKRNSSVSHIYDNYLLYASPLTSKRSFQKYKTPWFGSAERLKPVTGFLKPARIRLIRRTVTTHRPFSLCRCS